MLLSLPFLVIVGLILPALAWSSYRAMRNQQVSQAALPSARAMIWQTIILQTVVAGLAALAVWGAGITVDWVSRWSMPAVFAAAGIVGAASFASWMEGRPLGHGMEVHRLLRGVSPMDPVWLLAAVVAAVTEEFAYRGVLVEILNRPFGTVGAVATSAAVFGLAHFAQGWRGVIFSMAFGLAMQGLVMMSGGLSLAIVAHLAYDLVVAALGYRLRSTAGRLVRS